MKRKSSTSDPVVTIRRSGRPNKGVHQEGGRVPIEIARRSASISYKKENEEQAVASDDAAAKKRKKAPPPGARVNQGFSDSFDTRTLALADKEDQSSRNDHSLTEPSVIQESCPTIPNTLDMSSPTTKLGSTSPNLNPPHADAPSTNRFDQILSHPTAETPLYQLVNPVVQSSQSSSSKNRSLPFFLDPNLVSTSLRQTSVFPTTSSTQGSVPSNRSSVTPSIRNFSPLTNQSLFPSYLGQVALPVLGLPTREGRLRSPRASSQSCSSPFPEVPTRNTTASIQVTQNPLRSQLSRRRVMKPTRTIMSTLSPASSIVSSRRASGSNPTHFSSGHASSNRTTEFSRPLIFAEQLADKLMALESTAEDMQDHLNKTDEKVGIIQDLEARNEELSFEVERLTTTVGVLEASVQSQGEAIKELYKLFGDRKAYDTDVNDSDGEEDIPYHATKKKPRDNFFNNAVRKTMLIAMGLGAKARVKDVTKLTSHANGGGFVKDSEAPSGCFVRPDWGSSFARNETWHNFMLNMIKQQATRIYPAFTKEILSSKSDEDILHRMESVFRNFRIAYQKKNRSVDLNSEAGEDAEEDEETQKQKNRRWQRKTRKAEERLKAADAQNMEIEGVSWFFKAAYQSTDESDATPVLDPNTDVEEADENPVVSTRKPWITHPPMYRASDFNEWVRRLDIEVMRIRRQQEKDNRGPRGAHPRIRGGPNDTPLPKFKLSEPKIMNCAVDQVWLKNHPESNKPTRIQDWNEEHARDPEEEQDEQNQNITQNSDSSEGFY